MKTIVLVVGTRPNFMKAAPVYNALKKLEKYDIIIVHTGQHYDYNMSDIFFVELGLTNANIINLKVNKGTQNTQIANIMVRLENTFNKINPDLVLVFGDVTSTVAGALTCN
ncbi:MAG: UDP-N-acetylglucosamine 2-epimerase (non-hydrolyzing), partial [Candidatus Aenigmarchaeota archaeon]|nr:UDP-N-acetylglucosamine 2-epimerase (non-hydrolyzing) [Candidatus Aenigmarchaeota archaeon]